MKHLISVKGMTCNSCVNAIKSELSKNSQLTSIDISLENELAEITSIDNIDPKSLVTTIEDCGFDATLFTPLTISIVGMTCQSCVKAITSNLNQQYPDSIYSVNVSLTDNEATLFYDTTKVKPQQLKDTIEDSGFEASINTDNVQTTTNTTTTTTTTKIKVTGMVCMSCVNAITGELNKLPGVEDVKVSLEAEMATIKHDSSLVSDSDLASSIEDCGFDTEIIRNRKLSIVTDPVQAHPVVAPHRPNLKGSVKSGSSSDGDSTLQDAVVSFISNGGKNNRPSTTSQPDGQSFAMQNLKQLKRANSVGPKSSGREFSYVANLRVQGMTCASCVASIERHLKGTPGILSCKVALLAERADVEYNPDMFNDPQQIADLINDIGFEASMLISDDIGHVELSIFGMTCASCSSKIEREVIKVPGVAEVSVNLIGQVGSFKFDKQQVGIRDIVEKIESLGFNALIAESGSNAQVESLERTLEAQEWKSTFFTALCFSLPVSIISMILPLIVPQLVEFPIIPGLALGHLAQLLLTIPVLFKIGRRFHVAAYKSLSHGSATMDVLISLGTNIAFFASCLDLLYSVLASSHPKPSIFFETSSTLITFIAMGRWLENKAKGKTSTALSKLISLAPAHAILLSVDDSTGTITEKQIPSEYIQSGDLLKVVPGERIPCDATIEFGETSVDESLVTGEPLPLKKQTDDGVIGGTVNGTGMIHIRATRVGSDTTLSQIVKLVNDAQTAKAPIQHIADKVAGFFVPGVILTGFITLIVWLILIGCMAMHMKNWSFPNGVVPSPDSPVANFFIALNFCISVIVVACPCALGLATPTAVMVGTGVGAQLGILLKAGASLEAGYKVNKILFDKTGTLTLGKLVVVFQQVFLERIGNASSTTVVELTEQVFYALVGTAETGSEHPLGRAIASHAKQFLQVPDNENFPFSLTEFSSVTGCGIKCVVGADTTRKPSGVKLRSQTTVLIGNQKFLKESKVDLPNTLEASKQFHESQGHTVVLVAFDGKFAGLIAMADALKPEAKAAVDALKKLNIKVAMVTGDQEATAKVIAKECGISEVYAGVSPAGKKKIVREMQNSDTALSSQSTMLQGIKGGYTVAFIGDGINDSASIAQADLGIAVYGGTDVAVEAASVVLMRPDLLDVVTAIDLSRTIYSRIRLNFVWATAYNILMIPLAMGLFSPLKYTLNPMVSGMAMSLSSVSVVLSSLLLKRYKKPSYPYYETIERGTNNSSTFINIPGASSEDELLLDDSQRGVTTSPAVVTNFIQGVKDIMASSTTRQGYKQLDEELDIEIDRNLDQWD